MTYSSSLTSLCEANSSFDTGVLKIAYTGKNRNGSSISKDTFERCIQTLYNCPIVCNYDRENNAIGGHDMEVVSDDDGNMRLVNVTVPVGVVPESSKWFWSTSDDGGEEHEYLCADVLIWKRQEAYQKIKEDGITAHSMEITVKDGEMENGVFVIRDFEFTALCLLGEGHEPCFEGSSLQLFTLNDVKKQFEQMMCDLREEAGRENSEIVTPVMDNDINTIGKGGNTKLEEKENLIKSFGLSMEALDFSVEDLSIEELQAKLEEMKAKEQYSLDSQVSEELRRAMSEEKIKRDWGEFPRYCYVDHDADAAMVYCYDAGDDWKLYGFLYSMDGDSVVIDYDSKKRMKYVIVEFDNGEQASPVMNVLQSFESAYTENNANWEEKYSALEKTVGELNTEVDALRQFKKDTEDAKDAAARAGLFERFSDLAGIEEFVALQENNSEYTIEQLEEKCFSIRGKNVSVAKFSVEQKPAKLKVDRRTPEDKSNEPYGGLFMRYETK